MKETNTLIIGASISGLASAACLQKQGIQYIIIEKESEVAMPWRYHYKRLHLHTPKNLSNLPYKKFASSIPRYPSREQVVNYLEDYQKEFKIKPAFNTEAVSVKKDNDYWITETSKETFKSLHVIVATGPYSKPKEINFKGIQTFVGNIRHSCDYQSGSEFQGQKVLVVGFGNSACEIAVDLYEQGALPSMSVRSPVNIIPRDVLGIPVLRLSLVMSRLPSRIADTINAPITRLLFGNLENLGLKKKSYGTFTQIKKDGTIPLIDIGTVKHIRKKHIKIFGDIDFINGKTVHFKDEEKEDFDAIVAAIGYDRDYLKIIHVDESRFEDLKASIDKQKYFGKDGLYFCGFWIGPTGQIREIASDAKKIARDITKKENS